MGPVSISLALAAASAAAQVSHHEQAQEPAPVQREAAPSAVQSNQVTYRLPAQPAVEAAPREIALRRDIVWPRATPPAMPRDPFETPTSVWWQGSVPIEMQVVGVKFGWDL